MLVAALTGGHFQKVVVADEIAFPLHGAPVAGELAYVDEERGEAFNLDQVGEAEFQLEPFEPDLGKRSPIQGRNDLSMLVGKAAPKIQCSDWFNSSPLDLEKLRGKGVVLTMWGGFDDSPFAVNRINQLRALYDLYEGVAEDVAVVAVHDGGSDANEVAEYVRRYGLRFPVGRDADPFVTFVNYGINFIPQTVLIDKKGELQFDQVEGRLLELVKLLRLK